MRRLQDRIPKKCLPRIAEGLIVSKVRYGLPVFGQVRLKQEDTASDESKQVQVALNKVMRLLTGKKQKDHVSIESLLSESGLLSYNQMLGQSILTIGWKIQHRQCPSLTHIMPVVAREGMVTKACRKGDIAFPGGKSKAATTCFRNQVGRTWNIASEALRMRGL